MITGYLFLGFGIGTFIACWKYSEEIDENSELYQFLYEIGNLSFWIIFLGLIFILWG